MFNIRRSLQLLKTNLRPWPEGSKGLKLRSHREMVGGKWEEMGDLQYNFMKSQGLEDDSTLLEIGCGCFRAGRHFIAFLDRGNYAGIDKQAELIELGKSHEIGDKLLAEKKPYIAVSDSFDFHNVPFSPDYALAQSLFTHLSASDIKACLSSLRAISHDSTKFYCTFFEIDRPVIQALGSHSSRKFEYTLDEMRKMGEQTGWKLDYIGDWDHPRDQKMLKYYV